MILQKILNNIYRMYTTFFYNIKPFGFSVAFYKSIDVFTTRFSNTFIGNYVSRKKHKSILKYIETKYKNEIELIAQKISLYKPVEYDNNFCIWQCWWQGEKKLNGITKLCTNSVKANSNGIPINLITLDNYKDYIKFPSVIIEKYNKGLISLTELSDILRVNLLWKYGGIWIDATIFLNENIFDIIRSYDFYTCPEPCKNNAFVSCYKWNTSFMGGKKNLPIFAFVAKMFEVYWTNEYKLIDYYLLDYIIAIGYNTVSTIRNEVDNVHFNNIKKHMLQPLLDKSFDEKKWEYLTCDTKIFKLSRKTKYPYKKYNGDDNLTFYGYMSNKYM